MEDVLKLKIRFRRSTASDWTTKNPVLLSGEPAVETDTGKFKIGDGVKTWTALPYVGGGGTGDAPALILDHNQSPAAHLDIRDEIASKVDNADARLTDDRTPKPHNHVQSDVTGLSTALTTLTTSVASKVDNADARLTDDRTPKPHNHVQSDVTGLSTAYDHSQVVTGNPHGTTAGDITSGTFDAARIPTLAQSKVTNLESDLAAKAPLMDLYPVWPNTTDGVGVFLGGSSSSVSATVASAGPVTLMRTCTVSAVQISVNAGGGVGALVAIGIYGATTDGRPSTLVYDCGTVAASSGGIKTITLAVAQQLPAGLYFVATALAASTSPTIYGFASATSGGVAGFRGTMPNNLVRNGSYWFSTTGGAMSSTPTWTLSASPGPITANFGFTIASVP